MSGLILVGLGAMARYGLGGFVIHQIPSRKFPLATFVVNFGGCLLIGVLGSLAENIAFLDRAPNCFDRGILRWLHNFLGFRFQNPIARAP